MKWLITLSLLLSLVTLESADRRRALLKQGAAAGGPAWQDNGDPSTTTLTIPSDSAVGLAVKLVANSSGTVTKLRWHFAARVTANIKLALYTDSSGPDVPLCSGTAASPVNDGTAGFIEVNGLSQAVTSGTTYWIAVSTENGSLTYSYAASGGDRNYHLTTEVYAAFPKNPYATEGSDNVLHIAGMYK